MSAELGGKEPRVMEARDLYHIYREGEVKTVALRGVELALERASWTALMGPSGSGKSTLLHILAGLLDPSAGSVTIDGQDFTRLPAHERDRWRRQRVGIVLQRGNLHPLLDVADNVALPLRIEGQADDEIRTRVVGLLEQVGLADRAHQRIRHLSGGETQRVAIAVALAPRPQVLLADEPTGELDEATAAGVLDLLAALRSEEGAAILTVTHNPQVAERADRRLTMRDGMLADAH